MAHREPARRSFATPPSSNDGSGGRSSAPDLDREQHSNLDEILSVASRYNAANVNPLLKHVAQLEVDLRHSQAIVRELDLKNGQLTSKLNALHLRVALQVPVWGFTGGALYALQTAFPGSALSGTALAGGIVVGLVCILKLFFSKVDNT